MNVYVFYRAVEVLRNYRRQSRNARYREIFKYRIGRHHIKQTARRYVYAGNRISPAVQRTVKPCRAVRGVGIVAYARYVAAENENADEYYQQCADEYAGENG